MLERPRRWTAWYKPYRTSGRFAALRDAYARARRLQALVWRPPFVQGATLFPGLGRDLGTENLQRDGIHAGFSLPDNVVERIHAFARTAPCVRPGFNGSFVLDDLHFGHLPDGRRVAIADIAAPLACPSVAALAADKGLKAAAAAYLGYVPSRVEVRLWWSLAISLPNDVRRSLQQTIDFHYDVPWFNAVYAYFYLTAVTEQTGAHVIIRGSARRKPWRFLMASTFQPDEALDDFYGAGQRLIVTGPPGYGFLTDPFAFHKALAPVRQDRLMLQLRFL